MVPCFHKGEIDVADTEDKEGGPIRILVKMWKLLKQIAKDKEQGFALATNDFFRPDLKQIGNSIFEIRRYFVPEEGRTIKPLKLGTTLANVKDCLLELVENHAFALGLDHRTDEEIKNTNCPKTEPCFMFLSETLSVALDFTTSPRPSNAVCDVFIAFPTKPTMVLSLVDGDEDSREALVYNTSVARGVRHKLIRFMDEDVNSIHGVINTSTLKDSVAFNARLGVLANDSFHFVPTYSLLMNTRRYGAVLTAFWAGVAETKSVLRDNGDANDDCIRFLTKEQCIILVENINSKDVQVRCVPGSGATTLMLEVARRLSRLGDTLLVCRSQEERDRLRSAYASVVSVNDLSKLDLSSYVNIVDETNSMTPETRRHHWQFASHLTDIKQLKYRKWMVETETDRIEKLMDVLTNDQLRRRMNYLLGEFDVLVLMMEKLRQHVAFHQNKDCLENKPRQHTRGNTLTDAGSFVVGKPHPVVQEAELIAWQEKVEQEKSVFPLLRSVMVKDRTNLIYQGVKLAYLEKASTEGEEKLQESSQSSESKFWNQQNTARVFPDTLTDAKHKLELQNTDGVDAEGHPETIYVTRQNKRDVSSSTEPLEDIHTEDRLELQDTDVGEAESRMQEIESLNEELDSLKLNRDYKTIQLDKLQTEGWTHGKFEWQNAVDYLMGYPDVLSLFNVELPGLDGVSSSHQEDQDESTLPRRIKHRQRTVFTKDSKRKFPDTTSKLAGVKGEGQYTVKDGCHIPYIPTGLMHQLRRYQLGSLKDRDLTTLTLKVMTDDEEQLAYLTAKNDSLEKDFGSTVHIVGLECRPAPISCPKRHLDAARANTVWCHVTTDGELVNSRPDTRDEGWNRLQKYIGTCSSPIPLPPPPSTLNPHPHPTTPTYWETKTRVRVVGGVPWYGLEMGVVEAGQVDSEYRVSLQRRSWCVRVEICGRHGGSICTTVWREKVQGECHQNTMSRTPGTKATLHYGVVLDVGRGRVAFIDLDRGIVLVKYDEVFREPLVPMFSAGVPASGYTVSMSLISGEDVDMTDTKRALVYQALR
ncbi:uncharacterized protein LOC124151408 isoform X3 [Haliotis rufescens]|uniref:uncharacterized protein LOC124151408 isoform X3 n=1 Tax=Haliotis rufescens TaxID=6454 RepID=UPI00201F7693|nr:uncharacterized protein LOC124151408 isoform X3 [Haliotis rufescens]